MASAMASFHDYPLGESTITHANNSNIEEWKPKQKLSIAWDKNKTLDSLVCTGQKIKGLESNDDLRIPSL